MRGLIIRKAKIVHEDDRRSLIEIVNGEIGIRNLKLLFVKKGEQILGNHWHMYPECMYILKGSAHYKFKNIFTNEILEINLVEGDVLIKTGFIVHTGIFAEDSIIIDGGAESYIDGNFNDVIEKLM